MGLAQDGHFKGIDGPGDSLGLSLIVAYLRAFLTPNRVCRAELRARGRVGATGDVIEVKGHMKVGRFELEQRASVDGFNNMTTGSNVVVTTRPDSIEHTPDRANRTCIRVEVFGKVRQWQSH